MPKLKTRSTMSKRSARLTIFSSMPRESFFMLMAMKVSLSLSRREIMSKTSPSVGIFSFLNFGLYHEPASSAFNSRSVIAITSPEPLVVRSTVASWMTTGTPSLVR